MRSAGREIGGARDELDGARAGRAHRREPRLPVVRQRERRVERDDDPLPLREERPGPRAGRARARRPPSRPRRRPPSTRRRYSSARAGEAAALGERPPRQDRRAADRARRAPPPGSASRRDPSGTRSRSPRRDARDQPLRVRRVFAAPATRCGPESEDRFAIKSKTPEPIRAGGSGLSSFWFAPAERVGRACAALPGCLPPPPVRNRRALHLPSSLCAGGVGVKAARVGVGVGVRVGAGAPRKVGGRLSVGSPVPGAGPSKVSVIPTVRA